MTTGTKDITIEAITDKGLVNVNTAPTSGSKNDALGEGAKEGYNEMFNDIFEMGNVQHREEEEDMIMKKEGGWNRGGNHGENSGEVSGFGDQHDTTCVLSTTHFPITFQRISS